MWHMIICDGNEPERDQLMELARQCFDENQIEAQLSGCASWQELDGMVKQAIPDIVVVAQDSVEGLNTITSAQMLSGKIIWFSDLDFGVQSYRMCVPYFSKKPISRQIMQQALSVFTENCKNQIANNLVGGF